MTKLPKTINEAYKIWWERISPEGCSLVQTEEMYRAFYSGAYTTFLIMLSITEGPVEDAMLDISKLHGEFLEFTKDMAQKGDTAASQSTGTL